MDQEKQIALIQNVETRLSLYCPELMSEIPLIRTWAGKKLKDFDPVSFGKQLKKLLAEIVVVTGAKLYDETKHPNAYKGQITSISKLLTFSFSFLTFEEIANAFYQNSAGRFGEVHSHYGRELNVEFTGNVLASYKKYKQGLFNEYGENLVKAIKGELPPPPTKTLTDEDYLNDKRKTIEDAYQRLVNSLELNEGLFPEYFYDVMEDDGLIAKGLYEKTLKEAKEKIQKQAQAEVMWKEHKERERNNGDAIDTDADDGKARYEDRVHIGKSLEKVRWLSKSGLLKRYQPAVTVSKQMLVKEFFMLCFKNNDQHIYGLEK
jgi:hypothetical protein